MKKRGVILLFLLVLSLIFIVYAQTYSSGKVILNNDNNSTGKIVTTENLNIGDIFYLDDGRKARVTSVEDIVSDVDSYDNYSFDNLNFFANGVLVHNKEGLACTNCLLRCPAWGPQCGGLNPQQALDILAGKIPKIEIPGAKGITYALKPANTAEEIANWQTIADSSYIRGRVLQTPSHSEAMAMAGKQGVHLNEPGIRLILVNQETGESVATIGLFYNDWVIKVEQKLGGQIFEIGGKEIKLGNKFLEIGGLGVKECLSGKRETLGLYKGMLDAIDPLGMPDQPVMAVMRANIRDSKNYARTLGDFYKPVNWDGGLGKTPLLSDADILSEWNPITQEVIDGKVVNFEDYMGIIDNTKGASERLSKIISR